MGLDTAINLEIPLEKPIEYNSRVFETVKVEVLYLRKCWDAAQRIHDTMNSLENVTQIDDLDDWTCSDKEIIIDVLTELYETLNKEYKALWIGRNFRAFWDRGVYLKILGDNLHDIRMAIGFLKGYTDFYHFYNSCHQIDETDEKFFEFLIDNEVHFDVKNSTLEVYNSY